MRMLRLVSLLLALSASAQALAQALDATLYKNPNCGCCEGYAAYLRAHGLDVEVVATHDLPLIGRQHGVPPALEGCHTTLIDGYVVAGHVPVSAVERLLAERPEIRGISLPGMPDGSPGMTGENEAPFTIYAIGEDEPQVFAVE